MLQVHDIEGLRRSAAMAPLSPADVDRLLEAVMEMAKERARIVAVLGRLPSSFGSVRDALNELQSIVSV